MTDDPIKQRAAEILHDELRSYDQATEHYEWTFVAIERALREGMAMNERDAARYRWLVSGIDDEEHELVFARLTDWSHDKAEADAAIDAAMLARNGE